MPQMKKQRVGQAMEYGIAITAQVWDQVLLDPADRRRSSYESRLMGLSGSGQGSQSASSGEAGAF